MKILARLIVALVALVALSCQSDDAPQNGIQMQDYGLFYYDDEPFPVCSVSWAEEGLLGVTILCDNSPKAASSTYAFVAIKSELEGQTLDVERLYHNDDYIFVFESPLMFYSQYRALQSGQIYLNRVGADGVEVDIDVVLCDGSRFVYRFGI